MPQWSTVDGQKRGGFLCRRVFKKRLKIQFISFSFFFLYRYLPPSSAWPLFTFPVYRAYRYVVEPDELYELSVRHPQPHPHVCWMILHYDDDHCILIGPSHIGTAKYGGSCGISANGPPPRGGPLTQLTPQPCCGDLNKNPSVTAIHPSFTKRCAYKICCNKVGSWQLLLCVCVYVWVGGGGCAYMGRGPWSACVWVVCHFSETLQGGTLQPSGSFKLALWECTLVFF